MAAKGLFINSTEQGFTVRGINNNFFPDNATLAYPANSVILITDESDMATFRSASNYDVLFSALIKDININGEQVTKDSIIETFNEAANKPMSNPDSFTSVEYDGKNDLIFYNDKGEEVAKVDVTPFIKDGMIEDVEISEGNLVIHFNTDSEIKDIYIPLTEIFDPNQYYTKTDANSLFATQVVVNEEIASRIEAIREVNTALGTKADKTDTYTKSQIDDALALKQDASTAFSGDYDDLTNKPTIPVVPTNVSAFTNDAGYLTEHQSLNDYYTKSEIDAALEGKEDAGDALTDIRNTSSTQISGFKGSLPSTTINFKTINNVGLVGNGNISVVETSELDNYYTKSQVDTALSAKVSQTEFDTKEEVVSTALVELDKNKQDKLTAGANITIDANNVISATGGEQQQADWNQTDTTAVDYIKNKPTIPDTSEFVTKTEYNPKEVAIAKALTQLNDTKADKTELPDVSTFATKTEVNTALSAKADKSDTYTKAQTDAAIQTAVGQIDLSDYQTKADADVKEEVISSALVSLDTNKQDALVSGTNIKTINNQSILGEGNIEIQGGGGEQQQADWNQTDTTAVDYIKNKPTIPSQFTDVDDIQKVSALPANPDSRTLYLIPVE